MTFEDFKDKHAGESIIVCGLGESLSSFVASYLCAQTETPTTIGVNDIGRAFQPTYLLNVNQKRQYKGDRFQYIENSRAQYLFTHTPEEQGNVKIPIVKFNLGKSGGVETIDGKIPYFRNSPYMAVSLAAWLGARRIGLIGVDFTDNHFWVKDGPHRLMNEFDKINMLYAKLREHLAQREIELVNLSPISRLTLPKANLANWGA